MIQTQQLKMTSFIISHFLWVRIPGAALLDGLSLEFLIKLPSYYQLGLQSFEGTTWGGSAPKLTHVVVGKLSFLLATWLSIGCLSNLMSY